jgi:hypothetical protein
MPSTLQWPEYYSTSQLVRFDVSPRNPFADFLVERRGFELWTPELTSGILSWVHRP